jgi:5-methylcytosine-specific restriction endonuclease McrA
MRWCLVCKAVLPAQRLRVCGPTCAAARRRRKKRGRGSSRQLRRRVYRRDGGVCALCGASCGPSSWQADHIIPIADGGAARDLRNVRTLCIPCHRRETARWRAARRWLERLGRP